MKNILIILFVFGLKMLSAQEVISFRDGNKLNIVGEKFASMSKYQDGKISKTIHCYYHRKDDKITISFYGIWANGSMDELNVYHVSLKQLSKDQFEAAYESEADEDKPFVSYRLPFFTQMETPFDYETYSLYSSVPTKKSFNNFVVEAMEKTKLDQVWKEIYDLIPEEIEEVEGE
jgi:hypothetical protein